MIRRDQLLVGGWKPPAGAGVIEVINPATEEVIGSVPDAGDDDVDAAVAAARGAFESWAATPVSERAEYLSRLGELLTARIDAIGKLIAIEVGMPLSMATLLQGGLPALVMSTYAGTLREYVFEEEVGNSLVVREPAGVVGAISPWNFPLHQAVAKVAPALAAGCTVVLKPSEWAPLSVFVLADIVEEAGLPAGVLNVVSGAGPVVGEALALHGDVDMISFTGSTRTGRRVAAAAAGSLKRVTLELGGKSAAIVLDDADVEEAVGSTVRQCYLNAGQSCMAWSRLLVPRSLHDEAVGLAQDVAERYVVGDPLDPATTMGPLVSETQLEVVRAYIRRGIDEGARLVTGGPEPLDNLPNGYFVAPTVFAGVNNDMVIAREEIFGPVLSVIPYEDDDDAVRIANDTIYGLHGAVFSRDVARAERVARRLRTGQVDVNGGGFNPMAPFGGYKASGYGRELGRHGLEEYLEVKAMQR